MTERSKRSTAPFRYEPEDLAPRDAADEAFADRFIERNRKALNAALSTARQSIKKGKGRRFESADDLVAYIAKVRRARRKKASSAR